MSSNISYWQKTARKFDLYFTLLICKFSEFLGSKKMNLPQIENFVFRCISDYGTLRNLSVPSLLCRTHINIVQKIKHPRQKDALFNRDTLFPLNVTFRLNYTFLFFRTIYNFINRIRRKFLQ